MDKSEGFSEIGESYGKEDLIGCRIGNAEDGVVRDVGSSCKGLEATGALEEIGQCGCDQGLWTESA